MLRPSLGEFQEAEEGSSKLGRVLPPTRNRQLGVRRLKIDVLKSWIRRPGLDELRDAFPRARAYLQTALGVPVEVYPADKPGADPQGKSRQAEPGRPTIYIE